jgi:hypothetical protein
LLIKFNLVTATVHHYILAEFGEWGEGGKQAARVLQLIPEPTFLPLLSFMQDEEN